MYQTNARDWRNENLILRQFSSPISARNLGNDIPDQAVDTLLKVCEKNAGIFQRYFNLKAKRLKMPKLRRYDIYAPLAKSDKAYAFEKAAGMVLDSFNAFDPKFGNWRSVSSIPVISTARCARASRTAPSASVTPEMTPWVLLNYQGKVDDVATMAHELGHAIHSMLAYHHTSLPPFCLPLAETASTFGEMILLDHLLKGKGRVRPAGYALPPGG